MLIVTFLIEFKGEKSKMLNIYRFYNGSYLMDQILISVRFENIFSFKTL